MDMSNAGVDEDHVADMNTWEGETVEIEDFIMQVDENIKWLHKEENVDLRDFF